MTMKRENTMKKGLLFLACCLLIFTLCSCGSAPLTDVEAKEIASEYFFEKYRLKIDDVSLGHLQIGENEYLNLIQVLDDGATYELVLDEQNKPMADSFLCAKTAMAADGRVLNSALEEYGLAVREYDNELSQIYSHSDQTYLVFLNAKLADAQNCPTAGELFPLLYELKAQGIDRLLISITTPEFLMPRMEYGHGTLELQLAARSFYTDMMYDAFAVAYEELIHSVSWDREVFDKAAATLTAAGYQDVSFYVLAGNEPATIEVFLHCEATTALGTAQAVSILDEMERGGFVVDGWSVKYSLDAVIEE